MKEDFKFFKDHSHTTFGPYLGIFQLDPLFVKKILKLGRQSKDDYREALAGRIEKEVKINLEKNSWVRKYLNNYVLAWIDGYRQYGYDVRHKHFAFTIQNMWMNFMKKGEYNPVHIHESCHLSYVIFVKIPKKLTDTSITYRNKTKGTKGFTNFYFGENSWDVISTRTIVPKENSLLLFPAQLRHSVDAYDVSVERITAAGNIRFINLNPNKEDSILPLQDYQFKK